MYITRKGQYAIIFMIELALNGDNPIVVKNVARKYNFSEKYLEQIATQLRRTGIIKVIRGSKGGYYLTKNYDNYTVESILDSVEIKKSAEDMDLEQITNSDNVICSVISDIGNKLDDSVKQVLVNITLQDLVNSYNMQKNFSYIL